MFTLSGDLQAGVTVVKAAVAEWRTQLREVFVTGTRVVLNWVDELKRKLPGR